MMNVDIDHIMDIETEPGKKTNALDILHNQDSQPSFAELGPNSQYIPTVLLPPSLPVKI